MTKIRWHASLAAFASLAALLALTAPVEAKTKKATDYFKICKRSDTQLDECIRRSIQDARSTLAQGIPDLKMPPMDPFFIPYMGLHEGQGNFMYSFNMTNLTITGLNQYVVEKVKMDLDKGDWELTMTVPSMHFEADYEMNGRVYALPIKGNGRCTYDFKAVKTVCHSKLINVTRNGKAYAHVDTVKWDIDTEHAQSNFTNLFNGDKTLGDATNQFLNENWKETFQTYKHLPEEFFAQLFRGLSDRFFNVFPWDEIYPE